MRLPSFAQTHVKVALLSATIIAIMLVNVGVSLHGVGAMKRELDQGLGRELRTAGVMGDALRECLQAQLILEQAADCHQEIADRRQLARQFDEHLRRSDEYDRALLALTPRHAEEMELLRAYQSDKAQWRQACIQVIAAVSAEGTNDSDHFDQTLSRAHLSPMIEHLRALNDSVYEPAIASSQEQLQSRVHVIDAEICIACLVGLSVALVVTRGVVKTISAQSRDLEERSRQREHERQRKDFENRVHRGLDMAQDEDQALNLVTEAIREIQADLKTEILLADSSHAHLQQVRSDDAEGRWPGCPVYTPNQCPAVRRGSELTFETNQQFDACPYLKERPGEPCAAACVPLSIMGQTVGVLHAELPVAQLPPTETIRKLTVIASKAGERIGVIRAFAKSEAQAAKDTLTGLLNRRSLERAVRELRQARRDFSVVYGDLDHFKLLNDTHGHETGDRALRIFAEVIRSSIRPGDVVSRWGGEEFVILLPETNARQAADVLQRVRDNLSVRLTSGSVPPFTVSFGVCDATFSPDFHEKLAAADAALLKAKKDGRDRIVLTPAKVAGSGELTVEDVQPVPPAELVDMPDFSQAT